MKTSLFEYNLPNKNIAHSPTLPRDYARLMYVNKLTGDFLHKHFYDLPNLLTSNDVLVFNETKVFPGRLYSEKVEVLLLNELSPKTWSAMHRGKVKVGQNLVFGKTQAKITHKKDYEIVLEFNCDKNDIIQLIELEGKTPIPPYIKTTLSEKRLRTLYQTEFAKRQGSVAAPTAGMHFTKELIKRLEENGVQIEYITLHVGAGTFLPIKSENLMAHKMHSEYFEINARTANRLNKAKIEGKKIIAVGTTTARALETSAINERIVPKKGNTDIFIYPPYKFKFVDTLITNFHLPHSTLLCLVSAFVSYPNTQNKFISFQKSILGKAYDEAIEKDYKFYSFGDGMIVG